MHYEILMICQNVLVTHCHPQQGNRLHPAASFTDTVNFLCHGLWNMKLSRHYL